MTIHAEVPSIAVDISLGEQAALFREAHHVFQQDEFRDVNKHYKQRLMQYIVFGKHPGQFLVECLLAVIPEDWFAGKEDEDGNLLEDEDTIHAAAIQRLLESLQQANLNRKGQAVMFPSIPEVRLWLEILDSFRDNSAQEEYQRPQHGWKPHVADRNGTYHWAGPVRNGYRWRTWKAQVGEDWLRRSREGTQFDLLGGNYNGWGQYGNTLSKKINRLADHYHATHSFAMGPVAIDRGACYSD